MTRIGRYLQRRRNKRFVRTVAPKIYADTIRAMTLAGAGESPTPAPARPTRRDWS